MSKKDFTLLEDKPQEKKEYHWCWLGVHSWEKWSGAIPHKTYDSKADPTKLDQFLPISIRYTQERSCRGCGKTQVERLYNKEV